ncbi:MAG: HlyC/CorC family transporter [Anaerolineales bacterium]|nr:HlyC/CorC family transporter [Anaerolineales bacterium]
MTSVALEILFILFLMLLNGVFAMSEIAIVSSRRVRLQQQAQQGSRGAHTALELAEEPNRFLATVQVGITLVGIFAGAYGGATLAQELAPLLVDVPLIGRYSSGISLVLVVSGVTYLSVLIGELVPKRLALQNPERIATLVAGPMQLLSRLATPIVRLMSVSTDAVLRLLRVPQTVDTAVSEEEIRVMVRESAQAGVIEEAERDIVEQVFRFGDKRLEALMTPRTEIVWLDINEPEADVRRTIEESTHTRFIVCDGELDQVVGIVHAKTLLARSLAGAPLDLNAAMQEPLYLPQTMLALNALERFKQTGAHLALLVDEFGGIEGLVTLINILEALVGDIPTPEEMEMPPIVQREDGSWLVDGLFLIDEFKELIDIATLPSPGSYQTLGGFMILMLGRMPMTGDAFDWHGYRFEVVDMDGNRVDKVLVQPPAAAEE